MRVKRRGVEGTVHRAPCVVRVKRCVDLEVERRATSLEVECCA
jgi:hypothetical protein